ncbi:hypothetical protein SUGI_0874290 [Cryptomeria japonica]|uniref:uncharacterized protein LOC131049660 n=1 Tax=Cryptomeria japonica TaxID=3369 RepID=UPI0024147A41|nr:uncharacterized protein LOC131049660 [Cryptomeria japonica]GLJ42237.1 hypothetical protein SUGI_0874290 [Cryptomeria japonica]
MASGVSDSANMSSSDNECGFNRKMKELVTVIRETLGESAEYKKLRSWEYSQAQRESRETTNLHANESSQASRSTCSEQGQKFDVFLSHSGRQKNFVRQLHRDLTNQGVSCFFDEDRESCLPVAEDFPSRIFQAAETCKVAVLLLSRDFIETKWPMLELSTFVKARDRNPNFKILPLFFMIPPEALKRITACNKKWKEFEKSKERRAEWHRALKVIRGINGLKLTEDGDELEFRDEIVKKIWRILPAPSPRYHVPAMQGEARMCQEVTELFNKAQPTEKGIRIVGLYGIAGHGKATLGKAFCNRKLGDFEGRVCHLEFSRGDSFERTKLALQYLTHRPQSYLQTLICQNQAQVEMHTRVKGQRVLLVLDNVTEESIDEATYYLRADFGENSCILLSARSADLLVKHFNIDSRSCMRVPRLEEEEAIAILLERAFPVESNLGAENRGFALKCAKRCLFKDTSCDIGPRARSFHPLALKAFGGYLLSKYGSNLSKWVAEIDGMVDGSGDGLDEVFTVLCKAFDDMDPIYQTIFILLTVYRLPNMSPHKVTEWLAINCNEEIKYIKKAVKDLMKKAFIENFEAEIRIHDLYIEFAQSKAKRMERWLWWKGDGPSTRGLISKSNVGFELAKLEQCMHRSPSQIARMYLQNLSVLQLVGVQNMAKIDLGRMNSLRSITLHNCKNLTALEGMEKLPCMAWVQMRDVNPMLKLPELSSLAALQYLEIDIADSRVVNELGDLTPCLFLRQIIVRCPSLSEFPRVNGLSYLEKVEFSVCDKVKRPLDCAECVELQSIVLTFCSQMAASPLLAGCKKLSKIVLSDCDAVTACPEIDVPSALKTLELQISSEAASAPRNLEFCYGLENLQLWNMGKLKELPSLRRLSNLTVLKLGKCGIREPPDLTCCDMLEDVYFFTLKNLERFPNFSSLRKLKSLSLYNCRRVQDPPLIWGCHELQVFHLLYNDNMKGLPKMECCPRLEEIKVSWHCEDEITYDGIDPGSWEIDDDGGFWLEHFKYEIIPNLSDVSVPEALENLQWLNGKKMLVKRYFRGLKLYCSLTAPYELYVRRKFSGQTMAGAVAGRDESSESSERYGQNFITLRSTDSKVRAFPTLGRVCEDRAWLNRVQEYFDIACTNSASGRI